MTAWIALLTVTILFILALRHDRSHKPPLPPGYDGERQLAELHALTATATISGWPDRSRRAGCRVEPLKGAAQSTCPHTTDQCFTRDRVSGE
jgi:hypothetical protein